MQLYIPDSFELRLKTFGNETLLFHEASGDTLLLNPVAVELIECLQENAFEKESLFEELSKRLNYVLDDSFRAHLEEVLSDLVKRDIVATQ